MSWQTLAQMRDSAQIREELKLKKAFEEGVQHAVDAIRAAMKNYGFVCKTLNPDLLALQKEVGLLVYPLSLNRQAEDRIHRISGNGHNPQNLVKPVDDSVLKVLQDKQTIMEEELKKWKEGPAKSYFETLTNEQADRVLELVRQKRQDDKEVNALPNSVHVVYDEASNMSEEQWDAAVAGLRKYQDKHLQNKDLCKGDDT